jgi:hypothetical protein
MLASIVFTHLGLELFEKDFWLWAECKLLVPGFVVEGLAVAFGFWLRRFRI